MPPTTPTLTINTWVPQRQGEATFPLLTILALVGASVAIGIATNISTTFATAHAVVTIAAVALVSFFARRVEHVVYALCYIATCDVLWRMTEAGAPYEAGKYGIICTSLVGLFRFTSHLKRSVLPLAYLLLLAPSVLVTVLNVGLDKSQPVVSFFLLGPLALGLGTLFLRQLVASVTEASRALWIAVLPVVSIATIATQATIVADKINFNQESNDVTSGGFGPNQVSTLLGFGALLCLLVLMRRPPVLESVVAFCLGVWLLGQALLTFSRGGAFAFVISAAAIGITGLFTSGVRSRLLLWGVGGVFAVVLIYGWLNTFTDSALSERINDRDPATRTLIAEGDLNTWARHPLLGAGLGEAGKYRLKAISGAYQGETSHTEQTRLLAEHGVFGFAALLALIAMAVQHFRWAASRWQRFLAVALPLWGFVTMGHAATRTAAVALAFAFAALRVQGDESARW